MPRVSDEDWENLQPLLEKAKAEGNPWAFAAGTLRDDPAFDEWVQIMQENRRRSDENPDEFGGFMSSQVMNSSQTQAPSAEMNTKRQQLIQKAEAEGNPWAQVIGMFPDDDLTRLWIEEMKAARLRDEEDAGHE